MGIDYTLIASVLMYAGMVRLFDRYSLGIVISALGAVLGPFFLQLFLKLILVSGYHLTLSSLVDARTILVVIIQLLAALGIFYKLRSNEESVESWLVWAIGGAFILFAVVPYMIGAVIHL